MLVRDIKDLDYQNYRKPSMFIGTCWCDFKCCKEQGLDLSVCQNSHLYLQPTIEILNYRIVQRYLDNPLTKAIVFGGMEPLKQADEVLEVIRVLREDACCDDDVVIYTGYDMEEAASIVGDHYFSDQADPHIVWKFGRYRPDLPSYYDETLGVMLASSNQYGWRNEGHK